MALYVFLELVAIANQARSWDVSKGMRDCVRDIGERPKKVGHHTVPFLFRKVCLPPLPHYGRP